MTKEFRFIKSNLEDEHAIAKHIEVEIPSRALDALVENQFERYGKTTTMKGFSRPDTLNPKLFKALMGKKFLDSLRAQLVEDAMQNIFDEYKFDLLADPEYKLLEFSPDIRFGARFNILPKNIPELTFSEEAPVKKYTAKIEDEDCEQELKRLYTQHTFYRKAERPAQTGDRVSLEISCLVNGKKVLPYCFETYRLVLSDEESPEVPGLAKHLLGLSADQEKTFEVVLPQDYKLKGVRNKTAQISVKIQDVSEPFHAESLENFVEHVGYGDVDLFRNAVKDRLEKDLNLRLFTLNKKELLDFLDEKFTFQVPESLIETYVENRKHIAEEKPLEQEKVESDGKRDIKLMLLLFKYGKQQDLQVTHDELRNIVASQFTGQSSQDKKVTQHYQQNPNEIANLRQSLYEKKIIEALLATVPHSEVNVGFGELKKLTDEFNRAI